MFSLVAKSREKSDEYEAVVHPDKNRVVKYWQVRQILNFILSRETSTFPYWIALYENIWITKVLD
jgi:hypothetical protein